MPVLPLVGSTITEPPGSIRPSRSAASIIARPIRSFTLFAGFMLSSFATIRGRTPATTRLSCTRGVRPISSVALRAIFTELSCEPRAHLGSAYPAARRPACVLDGTEQLLDHHGRVASRRQLEAHQHVLAVALDRERLRAHAQRAARAARAHTGQAQRVGIEPMRRHHGALAQRYGTAGPRHAWAKHGPGRANLESSHAVALGIGIAHREHAARVVAHREIARFELVERDGPRSQHRVEHLGLPGRHEEARVAAVAHAQLARAEAPRALGVVALATEALIAEPVREPAPRDLGAAGA